MVSLAVCPSLQDGNVYVGSMGNNEAAAMRWLAEAKVVPALCAVGVVCESFFPYPQSKDSPRGSLSGLRTQMRQAKAWLLKRVDGPKVVLSLHTDSGTRQRPDYPHTWCCLGDDAEAFRLARALLGPVADVFGHNDRRIVTSYEGYVFVGTPAPFPSVLLEICCHQSPGDLRVLYDNPDHVARAIVEGVLSWGGIVEPVLTDVQKRVLANCDILWGLTEEGPGRDAIIDIKAALVI